jgi:glucosamine--fructose-6-phosphate aminotransferase (isomerizing)
LAQPECGITGFSLREDNVADDFAVIEGEYLRDILNQPQALGDTLGQLDAQAPVLDLARRLNQGKFKRVVLTGMGSSFHALHPLNLDLIGHGFTAVMVETSELVHYQERFFHPETLIVAVSQSGRSAEMVRLAQSNQKRSAVIAVTNTPDSPLAQHATASILTQAGNEFSVSCKTYVTALMALKWLGDVLCERDLRRTREELKEAGPSAASYLVDWRDYVQGVLQALGDIRHLFLVGRGASLASAGTGALILKEAAQIPAEGMSSAAFRHGPFEMLSKDAFVLVFVGDARTRELNQRLAADIRQQGGVAGVVDHHSPTPAFALGETSAAIRQILEILPVQMITLALAAKAGREPGRFELATKITTTE